MAQDAPPAPAPKRKGCCLLRLLAMLVWVALGFGLGWTTNEAETQGWNARKTWDATAASVRHLVDAIRALRSQAKPAAPAPTPATPTPAEPVPAEEPVKDTPPLPLPDPKATEARALVQKADLAYNEGADLFLKGKSVASEKTSNECYKQATGRFQEAIRLYEQAAKLVPDDQEIAKKISRAGEQLYWSKKLTRLD